MPVWDAAVRLGHWLLFAAVLAAWLTRHGWGLWHEVIGYASLVVVALRFVWGWVGPRHARFTEFVHGPRSTLSYTRLMMRRAEPTYTGHNPLGGWMVVMLMVMVVLVGFSGWLYTTDRYWGVAWVENLHDALANALLVLVAMHVAGVLYASYRHRENLILAMVHGRKRSPEDGADTTGTTGPDGRMKCGMNPRN